MRSGRSEARAQLRDAIQSLPRQTRIAMLAGVEPAPIIAGAYSNSDGICPMLAAHRSGGRTSAIAFAKAWDRFTLGDPSPITRRRVRARPATKRELLVLKVYLQASLLSTAASEPAVKPPAATTPASPTPAATTPARATPAAATPARPDSGSPPRPAPACDLDRSPELDLHDGWSWTRLRSYDEFELILATLTGEQPVASTIA
jgi:hypothetical protein